MTEAQIIIFDGVCNFCNGAVNFIIKRDKNNVFRFAPMQSPTAQRIIAEHKVKNVAFDTFLLIKNDKYFLRTDAALEITKELSGLWFLFRVTKILPRKFRDYFYRLLARNRYRLFGRTSQCQIPSEDVRNKFLW